MSSPRIAPRNASLPCDLESVQDAAQPQKGRSSQPAMRMAAKAAISTAVPPNRYQRTSGLASFTSTSAGTFQHAVRRVKLARISASLSNAPAHASGELMQPRSYPILAAYFRDRYDGWSEDVRAHRHLPLSRWRRAIEMEQAVAYVRVSSKAQGLAMQKAAIEKAAERARRRDRPLVLRQAEPRHHGPAGAGEAARGPAATAP